MKKIQTYFIEGFNLTQKSLLLFGISAVFYLLTLSLSGNNPLISIATTTLSFISLSYSLSIPYFLNKKITNKFVLEEVLKVTFTNLKRALLPVIGLSLFSFLIIGAIIFVSKVPSSEITTLFTNYAVLITILVILISSPFVFTPVYFSVENKNILRSLLLSAKTSLHHRSFVLVIAVILLPKTVGQTYVPHDIQLLKVLFDLVSLYVSFIISATVLIYYRKIQAL